MKGTCSLVRGKHEVTRENKEYIFRAKAHCCVECLPILYEIPLLLSFKASYLVNYYFDLYFVERQSPRIESTKHVSHIFWASKFEKRQNLKGKKMT